MFLLHHFCLILLAPLHSSILVGFISKACKLPACSLAAAPRSLLHIAVIYARFFPYFPPVYCMTSQLQHLQRRMGKKRNVAEEPEGNLNFPILIMYICSMQNSIATTCSRNSLTQLIASETLILLFLHRSLHRFQRSTCSKWDRL